MPLVFGKRIQMCGLGPFSKCSNSLLLVKLGAVMIGAIHPHKLTRHHNERAHCQKGWCHYQGHLMNFVGEPNRVGDDERDNRHVSPLTDGQAKRHLALRPMY